MISGGRHRKPLWVILVIIAVIVAGGLEAGVHAAGPYLKRRALRIIGEKFHADVDIKDFDVHVFPRVSLHGRGLSIREVGRTDVPPLIAIGEFSASANGLGLIAKPWKISNVQLNDLVITVSPRPKGAKKQGRDWSKVKDVPVLIEHLNADNAQLIIVPRDPSKSSHVFAIHHLAMHYVGLHRAASFVAQLTNPTPPGNIDAQGSFGPWQADDPAETPLSADYSFLNADLGVFHGIRGILSSHGKFGGVLNEINVEGETDTPDFALKEADHPVALHTNFSATVDGTNGNTLLHPVIAHFLNSTVIANGEVAKKNKEAPGREVLLDVTIQQGTIQDMLHLAVKAHQALMTGPLRMHTKFDLPPGKGDVMDRLKLSGSFSVPGGKFTSEKVNQKLLSLSRHGEGKPDDKNAGSDVSNLSSHFALGDGVVSLSRLNFSVPGADVQLNGDYGLQDEKLDFHGRLRMQAKLSQTVTGFKSLLLKPVDPFFRKNGKTEIPIKITGTRKEPSFGLDFGHKDSAERKDADSARP